MKKESIKLDCGYDVEVVAIDVRRTYGEFLVGSPNFEDSFNVFNQLKVPVHWGKRKIIMNYESFNLDLNQFKDYTVFLWLTSNKSIKDPQDNFEGSEIVVVWTIDDLFSFSINSLVKEGIKDFDWERYAVNFSI